MQRKLLRDSLIKVAKEKLEESKIALRRERNEVMDDLQKKKTTGEMSEDDMVRNKAEVEKKVQEATLKLDEMFAKRESEITS